MVGSEPLMPDAPRATPPSSVLASDDSRAVEQAIAVLARDGLVAFPTETVWGLAACAASQRAVSRLRAVKGREEGKPMAVLVSGLDRLEALVPDLPPSARALAERFWPGPLTLIVRASLSLAPGIASTEGAVGFRCSAHPVAAALTRAAEREGLGALTATSLNESGGQAAETREEAEAVLRAREGIDWMMPGESHGEQPSTVVDATGSSLALLRIGPIPAVALGIE